jgi:hypothetical protein
LVQRLNHLFLALALAALLATLAPVPAHGQAAVLVSLSPASLQVVNGQTVDLAVAVIGVTDLYAFNLTLTYDPALVEVLDADPSLGGVQAGLGLFMEPGFVLRNIVDNDSGTVRFAFTQLNPTAPKSGSGHLIVLKLRGKQLSSGSPLTLNLAELSQRDGTLLPVNTAGGTVSIVEAVAGPTSTALPTQGAGTPLPTGTGAVTTLEPAPTTTTLPTGGLPATATPSLAAEAQPTSAAAVDTAAPAVVTEAAGATALSTIATATGTATGANVTQSSTAVAAAPDGTLMAVAPLGNTTAESATAAPPGPRVLVLGGLGALVVAAGVGVLVFVAAKQK